ncbi:MAG: NUDIX domain-containing protein [Patescibacteria group bacterium]
MNYIPDESYKALMEFGPICAIDIIFFNKEKTKTLLGKRVNKPYKNIFYSFGGRLRKNELLEDAAIRIAKNETGIRLNESDLIFAGVDNEISDGSIFEKINYHAVVIYFGCVISSSTKIHLDAQHSTHKWINVNDANIHPSIQPRIASALKTVSISL